jgi:hypothetical protein
MDHFVESPGPQGFEKEWADRAGNPQLVFNLYSHTVAAMSMIAARDLLDVTSDSRPAHEYPTALRSRSRHLGA